MSSWRFSSFLKVSGQHTLGGRFAVTPADPRGGLGRCLWRCSGGSAPPTDPAAVPGRRGRGPGMGSRGEGRSRGGGAGSRASDAPSHQHLPSFCSLCAPDTAVGGRVFRSKELGTFSNVICGNVFHCVVFLMALLRNYLHKTKFNTCTVQ